MNIKNKIILTIVAHHPYIKNTDKQALDLYKAELFPAITYTYIPFLQMCSRLIKDNISFKIQLVMSPILCELLEDPTIQEKYLLWLEALIEFGEYEIKRTQKNSVHCNLAKTYTKQLIQIKAFYLYQCHGSIIKKIKEYADKQYIELMSTALTYCFLPHYIDLTESIDSQIEAGLTAHKMCFGTQPQGFWLPHLGYAPGIEKNIKKYGFEYTIVNAHALLFGNPMPITGIFTPIRTSNSLVLFAQTHKSPLQEIFEQKNTVYRDQNADVGFETTHTELFSILNESQMRFSTGFKYWSKNHTESYNQDLAQSQVEKDALAFVNTQKNTLQKAQESSQNQSVSQVITLNLQDIGEKWHEGFAWLEHAFKLLANDSTLEFGSCADQTQHAKLQKIDPFMSANIGSGYGENLLNHKNNKILRYGRKATERMIDLANRFPDDTGLKERVLNFAAKELLLVQSADLPELMNEHTHKEIAEDFFTTLILSFTRIYDSLGATSISTEWLTTMEKEHPIFPWINYRIFRKKR